MNSVATTLLAVAVIVLGFSGMMKDDRIDALEQAVQRLEEAQ